MRALVLFVAVLGASLLVDPGERGSAQSADGWFLADSGSNPSLATGRLVAVNSDTGEVEVKGGNLGFKDIRVAAANAWVAGPPDTVPLYARAVARYALDVVTPTAPASVDIIISQDSGTLSADLAIISIRGLMAALGAPGCVMDLLDASRNPSLYLELLPSLLSYFGATLEAALNNQPALAVELVGEALRVAAPVLLERFKETFTGCALNWALGQVAPFVGALTVPGAGVAIWAAMKIAQTAWEIGPDLVELAGTVVRLGVTAESRVQLRYQPPGTSPTIPPTTKPPTTKPPTAQPGGTQPPTQVAPTISALGCPALADVGMLITCYPSVTGAVTSWNWIATGPASPGQSTQTAFQTRFGSAGTYDINLGACNGNRCAYRSQRIQVRQPLQPPNAPTNAKVSAPNQSTIRIEWGYSGPAVSGFRIEDGVGKYPVAAADRSYNLTGLAPGTYRCFTVFAHNSAGEASAGAGCISTPIPPVVTSPPILPPSTPYGLYVVQTGENVPCQSSPGGACNRYRFGWSYDGPAASFEVWAQPCGGIAGWCFEPGIATTTALGFFDFEFGLYPDALGIGCVGVRAVNSAGSSPLVWAQGCPEEY